MNRKLRLLMFGASLVRRGVMLPQFHATMRALRERQRNLI